MSTVAGRTDPPAGQLRLRYWASARAAAGVDEDVIEITGAISLATVISRARELHAGSARFGAVLDTCSVLLGDRPVSSGDPAAVEVLPGQTVEFLPPFAGG